MWYSILTEIEIYQVRSINQPIGELLLRFLTFLKAAACLIIAPLVLLSTTPNSLLAQAVYNENETEETQVPLANVEDSPLLFSPFSSVADSDLKLSYNSPRSILKMQTITATRGIHLVETALPFVGTPYRFGGTSPVSGFDCSGFVQYVYGKWGVRLPRTAELQFEVGEKVSFLELQPGDLIFRANTYKHGISHVGIYIGNGKWIHAASRKLGVIIADVPLFDAGQEPGARRINLANLPPVPDESPEYAQNLMAKRFEKRSVSKPNPRRIAVRYLPTLEIKRTQLASRGGYVRVRICGDSGKLAHSGCSAFKTVSMSISRMRKLHRCTTHHVPSGEAG